MLVRAIHAFVSPLNGSVIGPSDILRDDNPHVRACPALFEEVRETFTDGFTATEEATANPGDRRTARRSS